MRFKLNVSEAQKTAAILVPPFRRVASRSRVCDKKVDITSAIGVMELLEGLNANRICFKKLDGQLRRARLSK